MIHYTYPDLTISQSYLHHDISISNLTQHEEPPCILSNSPLPLSPILFLNNLPLQVKSITTAMNITCTSVVQPSCLLSNFFLPITRINLIYHVCVCAFKYWCLQKRRCKIYYMHSFEIWYYNLECNQVVFPKSSC